VRLDSVGMGSAAISKTSGSFISLVMQWFLIAIAIALIGVSTGQFLNAGTRSLRMDRRLKGRQQRRLTKLRSATRVARLTSELNVAPTSSQGNPWRVVEVVRVVEESTDTKSFYLADPYQQSLPEFLPGQYLMVRPALAGAYQATRCYSLSVPPNSSLWRITVKKQLKETPPRPDRKTGALSNWLHDTIRDGDCLLVGGPGGQFYLSPENTSPLVLLAAGVGITPMSSILQHAIRSNPHRFVSLYYQVKDLEHWPLGQEVHSCMQGSQNCRVVTYLSRDQQRTFGNRELDSGQFRSGRVMAGEVVREVNQPDGHYFLCGPDAWMEQMRIQLLEAGVPLSRIHWESFGSGHLETLQTSTSGATYTVRFQKSNITVPWENAEQSLWELARAHDVAIPSGCLSGVCGSCRVRVWKGTVYNDRKIQVSLPDGECLACVARPSEDLVLDA